ncbi:hypothetical protein JTE90_013332 [Oedothorax gibbosus]|uniref:Uncharacterized protein n=1 Tax=Oedothorax gibbosus TaxID=931172 RepID=A0AAV6VF06_9ARAC|nr:hypothetical protein JTE90_013332 [Oedothorax gibbosus]
MTIPTLQAEPKMTMVSINPPDHCSFWGVDEIIKCSVVPENSANGSPDVLKREEGGHCEAVSLIGEKRQKKKNRLTGRFHELLTE